MRNPVSSPGYLQNLAASEAQSFIGWKTLGAAIVGMANSFLGLAEQPVVWCVFVLWIVDMGAGLGAAIKREGSWRALSATKFFDGILKGLAIGAAAVTAHLLEVAARGGWEDASLAAMTVLGGGAVSLGISIAPNLQVLWKDAGTVLERAGKVVGLGAEAETPTTEEEGQDDAS